MFALRMRDAQAEGLTTDKVHDLGDLHFLRAAGAARLTSQAQPDALAAQDALVIFRQAVLEHPEGIAGSHVHLACDRASGGAFPALVAVGQLDSRGLLNPLGQCVCVIVVMCSAAHDCASWWRAVRGDLNGIPLMTRASAIYDEAGQTTTPLFLCCDECHK